MIWKSGLQIIFEEGLYGGRALRSRHDHIHIPSAYIPFPLVYRYPFPGMAGKSAIRKIIGGIGKYHIH
jgi:hypothetical protein